MSERGNPPGCALTYTGASANANVLFLPASCWFSGLIIPERYGNETVPEVVSQSGYALLHFFSDAAYNLTGFNISYRSDVLCLQPSKHCPFTSFYLNRPPGGVLRTINQMLNFLI